MEIKDNFSIFNLFLDKKVKIFVDNHTFQVRVPTIREFSLEDKVNAIYHMWVLPEDKLQTILPIPCEDSFEFINNLIFQMGIYKEYSTIVNTTKEVLSFFMPEFEIDYKHKQLIVDGITITREI